PSVTSGSTSVAGTSTNWGSVGSRAASGRWGTCRVSGADISKSAAVRAGSGGIDGDGFTGLTTRVDGCDGPSAWRDAAPSTWADPKRSPGDLARHRSTTPSTAAGALTRGLTAANGRGGVCMWS